MITAEDRMAAKVKLQAQEEAFDLGVLRVNFGWTWDDHQAAVNDGWALMATIDRKRMMLAPTMPKEHVMFVTAPDSPHKAKALWLLLSGHGSIIDTRALKVALEEFG